MTLTSGSCETFEDGQVPGMLPALKMDKKSHMPRGEAVKVFENDLQCTESKEIVTWIPQSLAIDREIYFPIDFMQRNLNFLNDLLTHLYSY